MTGPPLCQRLGEPESPLAGVILGPVDGVEQFNAEKQHVDLVATYALSIAAAAGTSGKKPDQT